MTNEMEIPVKLQIQETVDEFIYKAVEPFAETIIGKVTKEEMAQILRQGTRKGRWIDHSEDGYVECPLCGHLTTCEGNKEDLHYCFWCGARLEADE